MRKFVQQHTDLLFLAVIIGVFAALGAGLLGQHVLSMAGWRTDTTRREIQFSEIVTAAGRDDIPAISAPYFKAPQDIAWLTPHSPVIVVAQGQQARAYPLAVMLYHQVVNDHFLGMPIAITYCPLCNSAIVYHRRVDDAVLEFAVSGKVRNSGFIMWDRQTESWWQQFTGRAIMGAHTGAMLDILPAQVVGLAAFVAQYPAGEVLAGDASHPNEAYGTLDEQFVGYDSRSSPFYWREGAALDARLPAMERVLAAVIADQPVAYPFGLLAQAHVINDDVAGTPVAAFWQPGAVSALDQYSLSYSRDVGMAVLFYRTLGEQTLTFQSQNGVIMDVETGSSWNIFGKAIAGPLAGSALIQVPCFPHFWFAWADAHPQTQVYGYQGD